MHHLLDRFNDLFSYCLLPLEGSRRIDLIAKQLLVPHGQFSYLMLLVVRFRFEMLDFIKHIPSVLSTFFGLGEETSVFVDGDGERCALI